MALGEQTIIVSDSIDLDPFLIRYSEQLAVERESEEGGGGRCWGTI